MWTIFCFFFFFLRREIEEKKIENKFLPFYCATLHHRHKFETASNTQMPEISKRQIFVCVFMSSKFTLHEHIWMNFVNLEWNEENDENKREKSTKEKVKCTINFDFSWLLSIRYTWKLSIAPYCQINSHFLHLENFTAYSCLRFFFPFDNRVVTAQLSHRDSIIWLARLGWKCGNGFRYEWNISWKIIP